MTENFDIIIVGGGMVGASVACGLGNSPLKVGIIEKNIPQPFDNDQAHDLRVSALSIASKNILETIGAWDGVLKRRYCPFKRMRVFETTGDTEFCSDDIRHDELGFIVENRVTQLSLLERLQQFDNIKLFAPIGIKEIDYALTETRITLDNDTELTAKVLVAADGGQSRVRQSAGLGVTSWDYQQHAMVIYIETDYPQQDITWQRFTPTGPQAFLPLSGHHGSIVWYHSADEIRRLKS
ncbi:MAG: FAD-dependent monooxygenase, partial [Methylococcales bacterium]|nr:FAD-dependent monooxygenase [Methylococcales bacterium]